ncbi:MAG: DUF655 domain-containing protein [archaeon]
MTTEENAIVLDFMPTGKSSSSKPEALAQVIGKDYFTLLEVVAKPGVNLTVGEQIYVGKETREKIDLIKGRIMYKDLTSNSVAEIEDVLAKMVVDNKEKFLNFLNNSRAISLKRHQLQLLPGMGQKHMLLMLDERAKKPFTTLEEVQTRVKGAPDPIKAIVKRIIEELEGPEDKHYLFVRPPAEPREEMRPFGTGPAPRRNFR